MFAAFMIGASLACAGVAGSVRLRMRAAHLRAWQRAVYNMHAACAYARATSAQILRAGAAEIPFLQEIARAVELNGADAARLFAVHKNRMLKSEERETLTGVMRALACGGREEQAAALEFAMRRFDGFCEKGDGRRDADARLYLTLGVLGGLCAFLILC